MARQKIPKKPLTAAERIVGPVGKRRGEARMLNEEDIQALADLHRHQMRAVREEGVAITVDPMYDGGTVEERGPNPWANQGPDHRPTEEVAAEMLRRKHLGEQAEPNLLQEIFCCCGGTSNGAFYVPTVGPNGEKDAQLVTSPELEKKLTGRHYVVMLIMALIAAMVILYFACIHNAEENRENNLRGRGRLPERTVKIPALRGDHIRIRSLQKADGKDSAKLAKGKTGQKDGKTKETAILVKEEEEEEEEDEEDGDKTKQQNAVSTTGETQPKKYKFVLTGRRSTVQCLEDECGCDVNASGANAGKCLCAIVLVISTIVFFWWLISCVMLDDSLGLFDPNVDTIDGSKGFFESGGAGVVYLTWFVFMFTAMLLVLKLWTCVYGKDLCGDRGLFTCCPSVPDW